jgi:hypothetical protein
MRLKVYYNDESADGRYLYINPTVDNTSLTVNDLRKKMIQLLVGAPTTTTTTTTTKNEVTYVIYDSDNVRLYDDDIPQLKEDQKLYLKKGSSCDNIKREKIKLEKIKHEPPRPDGVPSHVSLENRRAEEKSSDVSSVNDITEEIIDRKRQATEIVDLCDSSNDDGEGEEIGNKPVRKKSKSDEIENKATISHIKKEPTRQSSVEYVDLWDSKDDEEEEEEIGNASANKASKTDEIENETRTTVIKNEPDVTQKQLQCTNDSNSNISQHNAIRQEPGVSEEETEEGEDGEKKPEASSGAPGKDDEADREPSDSEDDDGPVDDGVLPRSLVASYSNIIKAWIEDATRCWESEDSDTSMFGVLSMLPSSSSRRILISPGISFEVIYETMEILHDPKNNNLFQYEPIFSGNHRDIKDNLIGEDKASIFWPHNVSKEHNYGHFKTNLAPRDVDLNGGDHLILARAANTIGAGASEIYNKVAGTAMQNLEKFIMAEFQKMYPKITSESKEVLSEEEKPYFVTHSIPGKPFESREKIDFEKFDSIDELYNVKSLYKNRVEYDSTNGRMKNCGDDKCLQLIPRFVKINESCNEDFHIPDKYALNRAKWVEKHGGGLERYGFKVGYIAIVPLTFNGCIVSILLPDKRSSNGLSNDIQWNIYDLHIPFGSAAFIRLDTYHSILNGTPGTVRYSCLLLTTKTAFIEEPLYFRKKEPTAFENLISIVPRYLKWAYTLSKDVYGVDVPVQEYKRFAFRVHGSGTRHDDLLIKNFLSNYRYCMNGHLQNYFGFENVVNDVVHRDMVLSSPSQSIREYDNSKKKKCKEERIGRNEWIQEKFALSPEDRVWFALIYRRRYERKIVSAHRAEFKILKKEQGNGKIKTNKSKGIRDNNRGPAGSLWFLGFCKISASAED